MATLLLYAYRQRHFVSTLAGARQGLNTRKVSSPPSLTAGIWQIFVTPNLGVAECINTQELGHSNGFSRSEPI